jgi:hypothetical protein
MPQERHALVQPFAILSAAIELGGSTPHGDTREIIYRHDLDTDNDGGSGHV